MVAFDDPLFLSRLKRLEARTEAERQMKRRLRKKLREEKLQDMGFDILSGMKVRIQKLIKKVFVNYYMPCLV